MAVINLPRHCVITLLLVVRCSTVAGQTARDSQGFVGVKGGMNLEQGEDALSGTVAAGGLFGGFRFSREWAVEIDLWVPSRMRDSPRDSTHRDILLSVSAVRLLGAQAVRPYFVGGLGFARTENRLTTCFADQSPDSAGVSIPTIVDCADPNVQEHRREQFNGSARYVVGGLGVELPLWRRLHLVAEVRVHVALTSVILHPALGARLNF